MQSMGFYAGGALPGIFCFPSQPSGLIFGSRPEHKKSGVKPEGLEHPAVVTEYERAMRAFMYKINLASNRVRRCFWAM